jgi:hypothetical protein
MASAPGLAEAGNGDRALCHFRRPQPPGAGAGDEIAHAGHRVVQRHGGGVHQGRRHEPAAAQRDGDTGVDQRRRAQTAILCVVAVHDRHLRRRERAARTKIAPSRMRPAGGTPRVPGLKEVDRGVHVDGVGQVEMRDLRFERVIAAVMALRISSIGRSGFAAFQGLPGAACSTSPAGSRHPGRCPSMAAMSTPSLSASCRAAGEARRAPRSAGGQGPGGAFGGEAVPARVRGQVPPAGATGSVGAGAGSRAGALSGAVPGVGAASPSARTDRQRRANGQFPAKFGQ